jgi:rhodanese-related sulfurtransferase
MAPVSASVISAISAFLFYATWQVALACLMGFVGCMKAFLLLLLSVILTCGVSAAPAEAAQPSATATTAKNVSPDEAEALMKNSPKLLIIDVRTPEEFAKGHITGAKNIDFFGDDFEKRVAALDPAIPVLVHCAAGNRSSQAVEIMTALKKFGVIYHLKAGFSGWTAAKKPVAGRTAGDK